ncbi:MAG TPA: nucleotide pyrophosphatase [Verrucomicrobiales bacterium]|nr:nucleotide pyrophosphatase [Verrucomicrobiales bacterium]
MIDACGWEIINRHRFAQDLLPDRRKINTVFGYTSACLPSVLSGSWPDENLHWSYFFHSPETSPIESFRHLDYFPKCIAERRRVRRWLSRFFKWKLGFEGYFDLFNVPFNDLPEFDFNERKSPLKPGGINCGLSIVDHLEELNIPHHVSDPDKSENEDHRDLLQAIDSGNIDFAFSYWPCLDGLLHRVGNDSPLIPQKLAEYESWLKQIQVATQKNYEGVHFYVFSDHGMADFRNPIDIKRTLANLPVKSGKDYSVMLDSTMARFWFLNQGSRQCIEESLLQVKGGRIVSETELKSWHTWFNDHRFWELIYLMDEGNQIVPSHMGLKPMAGMHGYDPFAPHSFASLMTNHSVVPDSIVDLPEIFNLMMDELAWNQGVPYLLKEDTVNAIESPLTSAHSARAVA